MAEQGTVPKASVFIATSLDGYIAREDGAIDWLGAGDGDGGGEDYGYRSFFDSVDALVMGRNTYDLVRAFPTWPYGSKPVFVLSTRALEDAPPTVERLTGGPNDVLQALAARGIRHVYVDGGKTIQGFLNEGLIQRLIITRIPVLIGRGIPLYGDVPGDVRLRHIATRSYETGLVQTEYAAAAR